MIKLFGHPDSGHAYKVRLMLAVAQIPHTYEYVDIFTPRDCRSAEFQQHARYGEVPLLIDDGIAYTQSNAILLHLARHHRAWGAEDPQTLQRCTEWLFWEANKIGLCLPQLRADKRFEDARLTTDARQWLMTRYEHDVALIDDALGKTGAFVVGTAPTVCDFSLCAYLHYANEAHVEVPTNVTLWLQRISELPGWLPPYELLKANR